MTLFPPRLCAALAAVLCGGFATGLPRAAQAQTNYTIQASGLISSVSDPSHNLDSSVRTGIPYTYTFTFSMPVRDIEASDPLNSQFELPGDFYGATVTVGDYTLTHTNAPPFLAIPEAVFVGADPTLSSSQTYRNNYIELYTDGAVVSSPNPAAVPPFAGFAGLILLSKPPRGLPTDAEPGLSAYTLSNFGSHNLSLVFYYDPTDLNNDTANISGTVTSLRASLVPTPEPSPWAVFAFMALGVGGLLLRARKA